MSETEENFAFELAVMASIVSACCRRSSNAKDMCLQDGCARNPARVVSPCSDQAKPSSAYSAYSIPSFGTPFPPPKPKRLVCRRRSPRSPTTSLDSSPPRTRRKPLHWPTARPSAGSSTVHPRVSVGTLSDPIDVDNDLKVWSAAAPKGQLQRPIRATPSGFPFLIASKNQDQRNKGFSGAQVLEAGLPAPSSSAVSRTTSNDTTHATSGTKQRLPIPAEPKTAASV
ncbi:hypothetical protein F4604DRAFT_1919182 [Suillus subluteus]|nr:hypothetical protein F4604DRAFT_1929399 [Suillus subluteus]KAG1884703.1 hypothetical protein F4604DRAFT_1919182 [Suillus subluteus]